MEYHCDSGATLSMTDTMASQSSIGKAQCLHSQLIFRRRRGAYVPGFAVPGTEAHKHAYRIAGGALI